MGASTWVVTGPLYGEVMPRRASRSGGQAVRDEVREFLVEAFGARPRRSWGFDALYHRGRLFVLFDGDDMVGKWPPAIREELRAAVPGSHAFLDDADSPEARWQSVPLAAIGSGRAIELALTAAAYVHTPEGAPRRRRLSSAR